MYCTKLNTHKGNSVPETFASILSLNQGVRSGLLMHRQTQWLFLKTRNHRVGTAKKRCACSVRDCTKWNCRSTVAESCCLLTASFWLRDHGQPSFPLSSSTLRA